VYPPATHEADAGEVLFPDPEYLLTEDTPGLEDQEVPSYPCA